MKHAKTYIALIISMVFWGFSFVWSKVALEIYSPITIIFFRLIVSSIAILIFAKISKINLTIQKKDIKLFILLAFFEPFLYFLGETFGLQKVSATTTAVLISTIPIFVPIFVFFIFKEKLSKRNLIGSIVSFIGILMIILNNNLNLDDSFLGILLILLAVLAAVGYSIVVKNIVEKYNPVLIVLYQNTIAILLFLPLFLHFDLKAFTDIEQNANSLLAIIELGIFASSIAFILFAYGIKKIGVSKAGFFTNLIPIFTSIIAFFILGEQLSFIKYLGIFIVVSGLFLSQLPSVKTKKLSAKK